MDKEHFYQKTWFKNAILVGVPTIISALGVVLSVITNNVAKAVIVAINIFLFIIFAIMIYIFSNLEDKKEKEFNKLKSELDQKIIEINDLKTLFLHVENTYQTSLYTISSLSNMFELWAKNINSFAKNIKLNGIVSDKAWDKIKIMDSICLNCKTMIQKYCSDIDDSKVSVGFISYRKDASGEEWVHMISHSNSGSTRPSSAKEETKLSQCLYHYGDLIKAQVTDIEVATNNEKIQRIFKKVSFNCDLDKYTQYIAIPVYCTSNKLLGIFQIVTKYGYVIEKEPSALLSFATTHIVPYSNLIVLIDKIYKGLYISPKAISKED